MGVGKSCLLIALMLAVIVTGQSPDISNLDLTEKITPLGIAPSPQDGYGSGPNQLAQPDDVEFLADGSLLVSDVNNDRIQLFSPSGKFVSSITADDLGLSGEIAPTGIAKDGGGYIYVTLEEKGTIVRLNPDLTVDQFIGKPCDISEEDYYRSEYEDCLLKPQGLIVSPAGDVFVVDMAKKIFRKGKVYNFGFRKFRREGSSFRYDTEFAASQEVTQVMRKSEGMFIDDARRWLFIAEEKPLKNQFGNSAKYRYVALFDLDTGKFLERLLGVTMQNGSIVSGLIDDSVEGVRLFGNYLFAVDEKGGRVYVVQIQTGKLAGFFGKNAFYYCDDHSDCVIDGINYNEQNIIAGGAFPHLKNSWRKNELASPDGVAAVQLEDGSRRLAVVDQWNSRIVIYDLDQILALLTD